METAKKRNGTEPTLLLLILKRLAQCKLLTIKLIRMTALELLKKVRSEMRPNAKAGEYELPVILKAMHDFAALRQPLAKKSVCYKDCGNTLPSGGRDNICLNCGSSILNE